MTDWALAELASPLLLLVQAAGEEAWCRLERAHELPLAVQDSPLRTVGHALGTYHW